MAKAPEKKTTESKAKKSTTEKAAAKEALPKTLKVKAKPKADMVAKSRCGGKSCRIKACKRSYRAKGYCATHYREWRQGKFGIARYKTCADITCRKPMGKSRHGFCEEHFQNYYVKGIEQAKVAAPEKADAKPAATA